ncbi:MAG: adenosine deaminase [Spirochaetia bacterium]
MEKKTVNKQELRSIVASLPKTEIHLHLEGLASVDTIWKLKQKHNLTFDGISSKVDLYDRFKVDTLNDFIDLFINVVQNAFQKEEDILLLIEDARKYLKRNNIVYAEIFFAPSKFVRNGFSFQKIVELLDEGAKKLEREDNLRIKYIMDVSRTFGPENAMKNLDLTLKHKKNSVIGIGLGGAENKGPAQDYKKVFEKARSEELHTVAHAGEDMGPESIWHAIEDLHTERIGHGISAIQDEALQSKLVETQLPLEICPKSNIITGRYVKTYQDHPIRAFFDKGINVTLNTDDPTIFGAELNDEYMNLLTEKVFSFKEVVKLLKNTLYATFLSDQEKNEIWNTVLPSLTNLGDK